MSNSVAKLLFYAILKVFNSVLEKLCHIIEKYKLEQQDLNKKTFHIWRTFGKFSYNHIKISI